MKPVAVFAIVMGVVLLGVAALYFVMAPGSLPSFLPGYEQGVTVGPHTKHGIGALVLALAFFTLAWFQNAPKKL